MTRTGLPPMKSCDGCQHEEVKNACCTIVRVRPTEAKRIRRYVADNKITWRRGDGIQCGFLLDGQCSIYEVRPWACRAFGVVNFMPCTRFPEEAVVPLSKEQANLLRLSDDNDRFLGEYFELGYNERMLETLRSIK